MARITQKLIAPCGMNCGLCLHYLRENNKCAGCCSGRKVNGRLIKCAIKHCKERQGDYCCNCDKYPCARLQRLDQRYRDRYGMSEIENLEIIKEQGIAVLVKIERKKWQSARGILCVHDKKYY